MTDEMLLAHPDWKELADRELARAVTLAKKRGRQTAELLLAQSLEYGRPLLYGTIANFDMYIAHCVKMIPDWKDLIDDWGQKNAVESCGDPRMAWFCVIYQRTRWKLLGNDTAPKPTLLTLQKIRDRQFENLTRAQYQFSLQVAAIHQQGASIHDPGYERQVQELHTAFMVQLDYAMLAVMTLNVATEEWLAGCPG